MVRLRECSLSARIGLVLAGAILLNSGVLADALPARQLVTGQPASSASASSDQQAAGDSVSLANRTLRFTGRIVIDPAHKNSVIGADTIRVEVRDSDLISDSVVWIGYTNPDGTFDTGDVIWTEGDDPDLYLFWQTFTPAVTVETGILDEDYTWSTESNGVIEDFTGSFYDFGTWTPANADTMPALLLHNVVTWSHRFVLQETGVNLPNVEVNWPAGGDFGFNYDGEIVLGDFLYSDIGVTHQYAHHLQVSIGVPTVTSLACSGPCHLCNSYTQGTCAEGGANCPLGSEEAALQEAFALYFSGVIAQYVEDTYQYDDGDPYYFRSFNVAAASAGYPSNLQNWIDCCANDPSIAPLTVPMYVAAYLKDVDVDQRTLTLPGTPPVIVPRDHNNDGEVECVGLGPEEWLITYVTDKPTTFGFYLSDALANFSGFIPEFYQVARNYGFTFTALFPTDTQLPGVVQSNEFYSPTHSDPTLSRTLPCIDLELAAFDDDVTGACAYSVTWSPTPNAVPSQFVDLTGNCVTGTSPAFTPGEYYACIRIQDCSGKWSAQTTCLGPFYIEDCNENGQPDVCDVFTSVDPNVLGCTLPPGFCTTMPFESDCNQNYIIDSCEIAAGEAEDCNRNGRPDGYPCENVLKWVAEGTFEWIPGHELWDPPFDPDNNDAVCIDTGVSLEYTVAVNSVTCSGNFILNRVNLTMDEPAFFDGGLAFAPPSTLTTSSTVTVGGPLQTSTNLSFLNRITGASTVDIEGGWDLDGSLYVQDNAILRCNAGAGSAKQRIEVGPSAFFSLGAASGPSATLIFDGTDPFMFSGSGDALIGSSGQLVANTATPLTISPDCELHGTLDLQQGSVTFTGDLDVYGTIAGATDAVLKFNGAKTLHFGSNVNVERLEVTSGPGVRFDVSGQLSAESMLLRYPTRFDSGADITFREELEVSSTVDIFSSNGGPRALRKLKVSGGLFTEHTNDDWQIDLLEIGPGLLDFSGNLDAKVFNWLASGRIQNSPLVTVEQLFVANNGSGAKTITNTPLTITQSGTIEGSLVSRSGSTITANPGVTLTFSGDAANLASELGGDLINQGTLRRAGAGDNYIGVPLESYGDVELLSGTLEINKSFQQSAGGDVKLLGGTLYMNNSPTTPLELLGGGLYGAGTVQGNVSSVGGTVSPGDTLGLLNITGSLTADPNSVTVVELGGVSRGVDFDAIDCGATADIGGTLVIKLVNDFAPDPNDSFEILTAAAVNGDFAQVIAPGAWSVTKSATSVTIAPLGGGCPVYEPSDLNGDCVVDSIDADAQLDCFTGPNPAPALPAGCIVADLNGDLAVDMLDVTQLQAAVNASMP